MCPVYDWVSYIPKSPKNKIYGYTASGQVEIAAPGLKNTQGP